MKYFPILPLLVLISTIVTADERQPFRGQLKVEGLIGYQIAAYPLLKNSTSFAIDEKGRIYVVTILSRLEKLS